MHDNAPHTRLTSCNLLIQITSCIMPTSHPCRRQSSRNGTIPFSAPERKSTLRPRRTPQSRLGLKEQTQQSPQITVPKRPLESISSSYEDFDYRKPCSKRSKIYDGSDLTLTLTKEPSTPELIATRITGKPTIGIKNLPLEVKNNLSSIILLRQFTPFVCS